MVILDIDLNKTSVNQCEGSTTLFAGSHKCRPETTQVSGTVFTKRAGPGCSKLTASLVNVSLKFQMLISEICQYFC